MKPLQDDFLLAEAPYTGLRQAGHAVDWFQSGALADGAMAGADYDVVLLAPATVSPMAHSSPPRRRHRPAAAMALVLSADWMLYTALESSLHLCFPQ